MANVFEITTAMRSLARDAFDDLLNQLNKPFLVIFPTKLTECPNCFASAEGRSAGIYNGTGPTPFPDYSLCPVCLGEHQVGSQETVTLRMGVAESPSEWWIKVPPAEVSEGMIQTKCFQTDLPNILAARRIRRLSNIGNYRNPEYELAGEPLDTNSVVPDRYAVMLWKRV
jgi:hypothetical protein